LPHPIGSSLIESLQILITHQAPRIASIRPKHLEPIPKEVEEIIHRALAKRLSERPTMAELFAVLHEQYEVLMRAAAIGIPGRIHTLLSTEQPAPELPADRATLNSAAETEGMLDRFDAPRVSAPRVGAPRLDSSVAIPSTIRRKRPPVLGRRQATALATGCVAIGSVATWGILALVQKSHTPNESTGQAPSSVRAPAPVVLTSQPVQQPGAEAVQAPMPAAAHSSVEEAKSSPGNNARAERRNKKTMSTKSREPKTNESPANAQRLHNGTYDPFGEDE
jgi:hypothetical protein